MNSIPFDRIAESIDLPAVLRSEGIEVRNGKALCPFHDNTVTPALSLFRIDGRWRFKCHSGSCSAEGDGITWRALRKRIKVDEAARELGHLDPADRDRKPFRPTPILAPPPRPQIDLPGAWADPLWQDEADRIIAGAESCLWSPAGAPALDWLRDRGLMDHTIRLHRLGFVPQRTTSAIISALGLNDRSEPRRIYAPRGITIPWCHPEGWYDPNGAPDGPRWVGCNVRRLADVVADPLPDRVEKCMAFAGSHRGYPFPHADLISGLPLIVCEGEWDALIAWQELGWIANVATTGGTKGEPRVATLEAFAACPHWLIATHNDEAGCEAAKAWDKRAGGKAIRLLLSPDRDLNDMLLDGTDLRSWLHEEYDLLDWAWPEHHPREATRR